MKYTKLLFAVAILLQLTSTEAQIIIQPQVTAGSQLTLDNLYAVFLINSTPSAITGYLQIKIVDINQKQTFLSQTPQFSIPSGNFVLPVSIAVGSTRKFGSNSSGVAFSQTGILPAGVFTICYSFIAPGEAGVKGLNCRQQQFESRTPPYLVSPYNKEEISTTYPLLVWHPPTPVDPSQVTYAIKLTELKKGQSYAQALRNNLPLLKRNGLQPTQLPYPVSAPGLEQNKSYVWQVEASQDGESLGITEIWSFKIKEQQQPDAHREAPPEDDDGYYPRIDNFQSKGYYLTNGIVRFAYDNRSSDTSLTYEIVKGENTADTSQALAQDSAYVIPDTPPLDIDYGLNEIYLDLTDWNGWAEDQNYILKVTDSNGRVYSLMYLYKPQ